MPKSIEMIGSESASAQRVREYRERKNSKEKKPETVENTESNDNVTKCNSDVQKSNIEKELEKELEKENKKGGKRETTQSIFERLLPEYTISDVMADKLREWFKYKTERKDGYKEQGMKSLLKQVAKRSPSMEILPYAILLMNVCRMDGKALFGINCNHLLHTEIVEIALETE